MAEEEAIWKNLNGYILYPTARKRTKSRTGFKDFFGGFNHKTIQNTLEAKRNPNLLLVASMFYYNVKQNGKVDQIKGFFLYCLSWWQFRFPLDSTLKAWFLPFRTLLVGIILRPSF